MTLSFADRWIVLPALASTILVTEVTAQTSVISPGPSGRAKVKFEIRVPPAVRGEPLTGRVYAIFSTDSTREPRSQVGRVGAPLFGRDVERLVPGAPAVIDGTDLGTPVFDMPEITRRISRFTGP